MTGVTTFGAGVATGAFCCGIAPGLVTTGVTGGLLAMAGCDGGVVTAGVATGAGRNVAATLGAIFACSCAWLWAGLWLWLGPGPCAGWPGACSIFSRISFATSPGLEIRERSTLVLISPGVSARRVSVPAPPAPLPPLPRYWRTRSASSSSRELEWVFFSVTPTFASTSRIALLLTSNSLAKSLIRTLLK